MEPLPIAVISATTSALMQLQQLIISGWRGQVTVWHNGELFDGLDEAQQVLFKETVKVAIVHHLHQPWSVVRCRGDVVIDGTVYARVLQ